MRTCSRTACSAPAVATLTYVYADKAAVLGPLAAAPEPGSYDLCAEHAQRTSVPQGWEQIRIPLNAPITGEPHDDLMALAEAVRAIGLRDDDPPAVPAEPKAPTPRRGGHLRLVPRT